MRTAICYAWDLAPYTTREDWARKISWPLGGDFSASFLFCCHFWGCLQLFLLGCLLNMKGLGGAENC